MMTMDKVRCFTAILFFAFFTLIWGSANICSAESRVSQGGKGKEGSPRRYQITEEKIFVVEVTVTTEEQAQELRIIGLKDKHLGTFTYEVTDSQLSRLKERGLEVEVLKQAVMVTGKKMESQQLSEERKGTADEYEYGANGIDVDIPDYNGWVYSPITISGAPDGAIVTSIDVHYEIIHTYVGDLIVDLTDEDITSEYRLWDREGGSADDINETETGITTFNGELVNQEWYLWAIDCAEEDAGYIDYWWIKVYYAYYHEGRTVTEPWAGWWWPCNNDPDPNRPSLWETSGNWQPMKRWDDYRQQGTLAWTWEFNEHGPGGASWRGHCNGWSVASYMAPEPWVNRPPFNIGDLKGLITECHIESINHAGPRTWWCNYPSNFWIALREQLFMDLDPVVMDIELGDPIWYHPIFEYDLYYTPIGGGNYNCTCTIRYEEDEVNPNFVGHSNTTKTYTFTVYMPSGLPPPNLNTGTWTGSSAADHPDVAWYSDEMDQGNPYIDCSKIIEIIEVSVEEPLESVEIPTDFALSQNYPNPFNPVTEIRYALPRDCQVKLTIYNLLGQRVITLVDEKQQAGYRSVLWDASSFASGIYFYRLQAGDFVETRKMILLR